MALAVVHSSNGAIQLYCMQSCCLAILTYTSACKAASRVERKQALHLEVGLGKAHLHGVVFVNSLLPEALMLITVCGCWL